MKTFCPGVEALECRNTPSPVLLGSRGELGSDLEQRAHLRTELHAARLDARADARVVWFAHVDLKSDARRIQALEADLAADAIHHRTGDVLADEKELAAARKEWAADQRALAAAKKDWIADGKIVKAMKAALAECNADIKEDRHEIAAR